ncbi:hypothetical protein [Lacrimispora indolis]|uniref:hypothetical protein n=1 Tax=Lacrimispora indolis TaxID=69825 RepID=UPI000419F6F9|nr:hypothetical protein [[Clostridium] methoxybenzovorans]
MNDLKNVNQTKELNVEVSVDVNKATEQAKELINLLKTAGSLMSELAVTLGNLKLDVKF